MSIDIFKDLTTEKALCEIEAESAKYTGLYVEMEKKDKRKYVKDKAAFINSLLKKLDRARIDKSKDFRIQIESEASKIKLRLENANKPFTTLIDEYKVVREKELAAKKAIQDAKDLIIQIKSDHDDGLMMNKLFDIEKQEAIDQQVKRDAEIARLATIESEARAKQAEIDKIAAQEKAERDAQEAKRREDQAKIDAEIAEKKRVEDVKRAQEEATKREIERQEREKEKEKEEKDKLEANKRHVGKVRGEIKEHIMKECKIDCDLAKKVVISLLKTERVTINY